MLKKVLKYCVIFLLLVCVVSVPLFGFRSFDRSYNSPGIFEENALFTNRQFGGGTSVYLAFSEDEAGNVTSEDYKKSATILQERFTSMGYSDAVTEAVEGAVRVDIAQKTYLDSVIGQATAPGKWSFVGSNLTDVVCDASMVEDAYVVANPTGGYGIKLEFTEAGEASFANKAASYVASSSYIYLMLDGQFTASAQVTALKDSFTFGAYEQSSASMIATFIKYGELPASMVIEKTEALAPTIPSSVTSVIAIVLAVLFVAACALLIVKGKMTGLFAAFVLISDVAVLTTSMLNGGFMFNVATLVAMTILVLLSAIYLIKVVAPFGKLAKEKKPISALELKALAKEAVRTTWIHALLLTVALICLFTISGSFIYVVRCVLVFTCADFLAFFAFLFFGVHTQAKA